MYYVYNVHIADLTPKNNEYSILYKRKMLRFVFFKIYFYILLAFCTI